MPFNLRSKAISLLGKPRCCALLLDVSLCPPHPLPLQYNVTRSMRRRSISVIQDQKWDALFRSTSAILERMVSFVLPFFHPPSPSFLPSPPIPSFLPSPPIPFLPSPSPSILPSLSSFPLPLPPSITSTSTIHRLALHMEKWLTWQQLPSLSSLMLTVQLLWTTTLTWRPVPVCLALQPPPPPPPTAALSTAAQASMVYTITRRAAEYAASRYAWG